MRNKYDKTFENNMIVLAPFYTLDELHKYSIEYGYNITKKQLQLYLSKRKIRYKDYNANKVRDMGDDYPIGYEYIKPDGMVLVKVAKDKYKYKQRLIYEQYYGVELTDDDYIIFLDQDRTNFDINNLKKVTRRESSVVANQKLFFKESNLTETGIEIAKLMIKAKDKKGSGVNWITKTNI